jgi:hypothetical protein
MIDELLLQLDDFAKEIDGPEMSDPHQRIQERIAALRSQMAADPPPVSSGGGPHDPGMEARVARLESDVSHIQKDVRDIKGILSQLAPRIDEMYGAFVRTATKEDVALLRAATKEDIALLRVDVEKRPTWARVTATVGFIALLTLLPFWQQWVALFRALTIRP